MSVADRTVSVSLSFCDSVTTGRCLCGAGMFELGVSLKGIGLFAKPFLVYSRMAETVGLVLAYVAQARPEGWNAESCERWARDALFREPPGMRTAEFFVVAASVLTSDNRCRVPTRYCLLPLLGRHLQGAA